MNDKLQLIDYLSQALKRIYSSLALHMEQSVQEYNTKTIDEVINKIEIMSNTLIERQKHIQQSYEKCLQSLQQRLRKHIKNEIELKLYYQHLQEIIKQLKDTQKKNQEKYQKHINILQNQISSYRDRMIITAYQTKKTQNQNQQTKCDTINKIKNRLSICDGDYLPKNIKSNLSSKRQSLTQTLQRLYKGQMSAKNQSNSSLKNKKLIKKQLSSKKIIKSGDSSMNDIKNTQKSKNSSPKQQISRKSSKSKKQK